MKFRANKMLGLAIGERSILVAEVTVAGDRCQVTRAGEFAYSPEAGLQQPAALGEALGQFLRNGGYTAHNAVFGIPARWVLSKLKQVPPAAASLAADMLRLQAESDFSPELKDLVYDFAGEASSSAATTVLLLATPKRHLDQTLAIAQGAKLEVRAIAPTSAVLSAATAKSSGEAMVLSITPSGTELAAQQSGGSAMLRYVGSSSAVTAAPAVAGEVRRAALLLPRRGGSDANGATNGNGNGAAAAGVAGNGAANGHPLHDIVVWDDAGLDASARQAVTEALGLGARQGDLSALGAGDPPAGLRGCASAVALAVAGLSTSPMTVDFLHSRLAAPKKARVERRIILAIAAAGAIVAGVIAAYVDQNKMETTLANKQAQLEERKKPDKAAVENVKMIEFAEQWHAGTPRYLDCLRDLLKAVPQDAQLYLTSFDLRDNMQGKLNGKTTSDKNVQSLVDRLRATHRFSDLKPGYSQGTNRADREVSFSLDFNYLAAGAH